jgi:hypothetical protein
VNIKSSVVTKIQLPPVAKCPSAIANHDATGDIYIANYDINAFTGKTLPNTFSVISSIGTSIIDELNGAM